MYNNPEHFLHKHLTFLESTGIEANDNGFKNFAESKSIKCNANPEKGITWYDWSLFQEKFKFFYDYEGGENDIQNWLANSNLKEFEYLYTWFDWNDPIVKVKTQDFIEHWDKFLIGMESLEFITENGELVFEFSGSSDYQLWSNYEIKPQSAI